jgi:hypothetical protein
MIKPETDLFGLIGSSISVFAWMSSCVYDVKRLA